MDQPDCSTTSPASIERAWIVFGPDWGRHPSVSQHMFTHVLRFNPIIWVETVGLRYPTFSRRDLCRSLQKLADFVTRRRKFADSKPGLTILSPPTLPFTRWRWVRCFNLWRVRKSVGQTLKTRSQQSAILVLTVPSQCDFVGQFGESLSIYYCVDDYALWSGMDRDHVRAMERDLLQKVDAVVVASEMMQHRMMALGKPVLLLPHGVDLEHFQTKSTLQARRPIELIYFGLVDERVDQSLLADIAQAFPDAIIRLIGSVTTSVKSLASFENLRWEGPIPYEGLPQAVATASVFLLPFKLDELASSCSPIKIKEYLACGRPVVASAIPEVKSLIPFVTAASSSVEFITAIRKALESPAPVMDAALHDYLETQSWGAKAAAFSAFAVQLARNKSLAKPTTDACLPTRLQKEHGVD